MNDISLAGKWLRKALEFLLCAADRDYVRRTWFAVNTNAPRLRLPDEDDESAPPAGLMCSARLP